jgi:hypothetical protein
MQSKKKLKQPRKYLLPYKITFPVDVTIKVNGKVSFFRANETYELTIGQYEAISNTSEYGHYIQ